jgi:hypothetical protein
MQELIDTASNERLLHVGDKELRKPLIRIFGERETSRGKRARVTRGVRKITGCG